MNRKFDIIVFGASGYLGKLVVEELLKTSVQNGQKHSFSWAIGGRSKGRLKTVLDDISLKYGQDFRGIEQIVADINNMPTLRLLASQCRILMNCVGPYQVHGEAVVKACLQEGTHHIDVSGEPIYLERTQLLYHEKAEERGVYIIGACGASSIPTDSGIYFLQKNFKGQLNSVEVFMDFENGLPAFNTASWNSLVFSLSRHKALRIIRKELYPRNSPAISPKQKLKRPFFHYNNIVKGWCCKLYTGDLSVATRSQHFFSSEQEQQGPIQIEIYSKFKQWRDIILFFYMAVMLWLLTKFKIGRFLLLQFPRQLSGGFVQDEKTTSKSIEARSQHDFIIVGEGWSENTTSSRGRINKRVIAKVQGKGSLFNLAAVCFVQGAMTLLFEPENFPSQGGVYTPSAAFAKTTLIDRLCESGISCKITNEVLIKD